MDEAETKTCQNCKREIPSVNFTIHSVHCARNIRVCPVCKEPMPLAELEAHHDKLHRLLPCKQCGEMVCGTDMEDHIRDSCALTIKSCRFCELEISRRELPPHESYCGARTEQCSDCGEWVMLKYRQLHLDSNHGFLRLDDDPVPAPRPAVPAFTHFPKLGDWPKMANPGAGFNRPHPNRARNDRQNGFINNVNLTGPRTEIRHFNSPAQSTPAGTSGARVLRTLDNINLKPKGSNVNQVTADAGTENRNAGASRGAVKKRPAPKPPVSVPGPSSSLFDSPVSPEPSTSPRVATSPKSDTSSSSDVSPTDRRKENIPAVNVPLPAVARLDSQDKFWPNEPPRPTGGAQKKTQNWPTEGPKPLQMPKNQKQAEVKRRGDLINLKPMSPEQFMNRFKELQLGKVPAAVERNQERAEPDRFSEIKSSLKQLRRGLNEVTAPYNTNAASNNNSNVDNWRRDQPSPRGDSSDSSGEEEGARGVGGVGWGGVRLPCEFCGALVLAADLVLHQTGCRPDLARKMPERHSPLDNAPPEPVIPCEFCTKSLPIYLISEHQERCGREANLLFPD